MGHHNSSEEKFKMKRIRIIDLLSNLRYLLGNPADLLKKIQNLYGNIVYIDLAPRLRLLIISDLQFVKSILATNHKKFRKLALQHNWARLAFGNGLLHSEGELWKHQRRLMQPFFTEKYLQRIVPMIISITENKLIKWENLSPQEDEVNIEEEMLDISQNIMSQMLFGRNDIKELNIIKWFFNGSNFAFFAANFPTPYRWKILSLYKPLKLRIKDLIEERRTSTGYDDLVTKLIKSKDKHGGYEMDDKQLHNEIITLIFAGTETTAQTLAWTWHLIARHPEVENKFHLELKEVLGGRLPKFTDISRLNYTKSIILEALRIYPVVWTIEREPIHSINLKGVHLPANSRIIISPYVIHHSHSHWERPDEFDPERFDSSSDDHRNNPAFIPFGAGPRKCIGEHFALIEMTIVLAMIGRRFRFQNKTSGQVKMMAGKILKSRKGIRMRIANRDNIDRNINM